MAPTRAPAQPASGGSPLALLQPFSTSAGGRLCALAPACLEGAQALDQ